MGLILVIYILLYKYFSYAAPQTRYLAIRFVNIYINGWDHMNLLYKCKQTNERFGLSILKLNINLSVNIIKTMKMISTGNELIETCSGRKRNSLFQGSWHACIYAYSQNIDVEENCLVSMTKICEFCGVHFGRNGVLLVNK